MTEINLEEFVTPKHFCKTYTVIPIGTLRGWLVYYRHELEALGIVIKLRNNKILIDEQKMVKWMQTSKSLKNS